MEPIQSSGARAQTGPNPRDKTVDTTKGRGPSVKSCRSILYEVCLIPRDGPAKSLQGPIREEDKIASDVN